MKKYKLIEKKEDKSRDNKVETNDSQTLDSIEESLLLIYHSLVEEELIRRQKRNAPIAYLIKSFPY